MKSDNFYFIFNVKGLLRAALDLQKLSQGVPNDKNERVEIKSDNFLSIFSLKDS